MSVTSGPACSSVLAIPELLENILSFLPAKMVFRVQCVSQTWKSTIAQSVSIQERLFLRYQSKPQEVWAFSSVEDERGDTNSFCCSLNIWRDGRIPPQTFSGHPECSSYRYFRMSTFVTIDGVEMPYRLSPESANHRILLVAMNPTLAIPVTADNANYRRQRRSFFEPVVRGKLVDPPILWWNLTAAIFTSLPAIRAQWPIWSTLPQCTCATLHARNSAWTSDSSLKRSKNHRRRRR